MHSGAVCGPPAQYGTRPHGGFTPSVPWILGGAQIYPVRCVLSPAGEEEKSHLERAR
jgi:hypothetical protein